MASINPDDVVQEVLAKVRRVRRKAWARMWQIPLAIALGHMPAQPDTDMEEAVTPFGPLWHPSTMYVPETTFAFTKNGNVLKTLTVVTNDFVPGEIAPERIVNEYIKKKTEFVLEQGKLLMRICDADIGPDNPQVCVTTTLIYGEPVSREYEFSEYVTYLDYPQGYVPDYPYKARLTGDYAYKLLTQDDLPQEFWGGMEEEAFIQIEMVRGRMALKAKDANGNEGYIADQGYMLSVVNNTNSNILVFMPPLARFPMAPYSQVIIIQSNTWSMLWRSQ